PGSHRGGPGRRGEPAADLLPPHLAAAAARAPRRGRAADHRRRRHLRSDLRPDQGRPRHRDPADLDLRLQHGLPVQSVRPGHGDAGGRPRVPDRSDDDGRAPDAAQLGEARVTPRERLGRILLYLALAVAILLALFPFWWMIDTSLKRP